MVTKPPVPFFFIYGYAITLTRTYYPPLKYADFDLWAACLYKEDYLYSEADFDERTAAPEEVRNAYRKALASEYFTEISVLSHPVTHESLLVGTKVEKGNYEYFLIAHWGFDTPTTIQELRGEDPTDGRDKQSRDISADKPFSWYARLNGSVKYGTLMTVLAVACWPLLLINWWLFFAVAMIVTAFGLNHVYHKFDTFRTRDLATTIFVINLIAALVIGIIQLVGYFNVERVATISVCEVIAPDSNHAVEDEQGHVDRWVLRTDQGEFRLDTGTYNGTTYSTNSRVGEFALTTAYTKLLVTYHKGFGPGVKYINKATSVGPASCG